MEENITNIIRLLGENPDREGLKDTPERAAKALRFLTDGYRMDIKSIIKEAIFTSDIDQMVIVKNIEFYSLCEHHLLPFIGKCHVGYLPQGKVLGLSKIARVVDFFARRLQIQENLTKQIADCIMESANAAGVGVIMEAKHLCMMMRGVEKQGSEMKTSVMLGEFRCNLSTRTEFINLIKD